MKALYTFLLIITIHLIGFSQPVIQNNFVKVGDMFDMEYKNEFVDPGPAGMDVTWDFSNVTGNFVQFTWEALDPAGSPFEDDFPGANVYFKVPQEVSNGEIVDSYIYYENQDASVSLLGSVLVTEINGSLDTQYLYLTEDPDILFEYPITFGDQFSDDVMGESIVNFSGNTFTLDRSGTTTTEADGFGTLMTPLGTFNNVLRVKRTEDIEDRFPGVPYPTTQTWERYDWMTADRKYILFHTERVDISGAPEQGSTYYTVPGGITSNINLAISDNDFKVSPNPANEFIDVEISDQLKNGSITIFNMLGQKVFEEHNVQHSLSINTGHLQAGSYFVNYQSGEQIQSRRIYVTH